MPKTTILGAFDPGIIPRSYIMDYKTTNMDLAKVMRDCPTTSHPTRRHYCSICKQTYLCGQAYCGTKAEDSYCIHPTDHICGGCFMRISYDD